MSSLSSHGDPGELPRSGPTTYAAGVVRDSHRRSANIHRIGSLAMDADGRRGLIRGPDIRDWEHWELLIGPDVFWRDCTMRRVRIVERAGETYAYAAVDRETGEVPLQLVDRAALVALCERLGWAVHEEKRSGPPRDARQRTDERHRMRPRRRVGGSSKYTSARKRQRDRTLGAPSIARR